AAAKAGKLRPATRKQHCQTSFRFLSILRRPKLAPRPLRRKRIHSPGLCRDVSAQRFAFPKMLVLVTKRERGDFHTPVHQGQLVESVRGLIAIGKTSMTVKVELFAEQLLSGKRQLCTRGRFVLVALDQRAVLPPCPSCRVPTSNYKEVKHGFSDKSRISQIGSAARAEMGT